MFYYNKSFHYERMNIVRSIFNNFPKKFVIQCVSQFVYNNFRLYFEVIFEVEL